MPDIVNKLECDAVRSSVFDCLLDELCALSPFPSASAVRSAVLSFILSLPGSLSDRDAVLLALSFCPPSDLLSLLSDDIYNDFLARIDEGSYV